MNIPPFIGAKLSFVSNGCITVFAVSVMNVSGCPEVLSAVIVTAVVCCGAAAKESELAVS